MPGTWSARMLNESFAWPADLPSAMRYSVDARCNADAGTLPGHDCWFNGWIVEAQLDVALVYHCSPGKNSGEPVNPGMQYIRITQDGPLPE